MLVKLPVTNVLENWLHLQKQAAGEYVWEIEGFSGLEGELVSPLFTIGGYNWQLACYPKGDPDSEAKGHLSLYLRLAPEFRDPGAWLGSGKLALAICGCRARVQRPVWPCIIAGPHNMKTGLR